MIDDLHPEFTNALDIRAREEGAPPIIFAAAGDKGGLDFWVNVAELYNVHDERGGVPNVNPVGG